MNRTNTTHAKKNPGKFGDRTGVFQNDITHKAMHGKSVSTNSRAGQALTMLLRAGAEGVTQSQALIEGGGWRLAAHVHVLRAKGFLIRTHRVRRANGRWHARYELTGLAEGVQQ